MQMNTIGRLGAIVLIAASSTAMAQTTAPVAPRTTEAAPMTTTSDGAMKMKGMPEAEKNSTRSLENGTASGKGSGPRAGSPNGN